LISRTAELRNQNKALKDDNEKLMEALYAQPVLERENTYLKQQQAILKTTLELTQATADWAAAHRGLPTTGEFDQPMLGQPAIQAKPADGAAKPAEAGDVTALREQQTATEALTKAKLDNVNATIRQASESSALVAALGSAATAEEVAQARLDALTASFQKGEISANTYSRAVAGVRDEYAKAEAAAQGMGAAQSTLGTLMAQNTGKYDALNGKVIAGANAQDAAAKAAKEAKDRQEEAAAAAKRLADNQAAAAHSAALLKENLENIQWRQYLLGMSTFAAGMSNFLPMGTGAPGQSSMPDVGTGGFLSGGFGVAQGVAAGGGTLETTNLRDIWAQQQAALASAPGFAEQVAAAGAGGVQAALNFAMAAQPRAPITIQQPGMAPGGQIMGVPGTDVTGKGVTEQDIISQVTSLYDTLNQQNPAMQAANQQQEMAWLQGRPTSLAQQQAITQLKQSMDQLTKSTDSLNATNQELLSPYYTQDPRTSHIGFRSQGMALGGYVDVPGGISSNDNMIMTMPVASGERIYIDPSGNRQGTAAGGNYAINISSPVMIVGNPNPDQVGRTVFQNNQTMARQLRSALK
jgi:hypothetical protein